MSLSVAIIINGISRKKKKFYRDIYPLLAANYTIQIFETLHAGHATQLAQEACSKNFDIILAAGGDGTLNQVMNGMLASKADRLPTLGQIPLGTGNDYARTCGLTPDPQALIQLIDQNTPQLVDIGLLMSTNQQGNKLQRHFINECSVGMGPAVVKRLENSSRMLGPFLTYWKAIMITFFTHTPQQVRCETSDWVWDDRIRVLAIANGRSFGNALYIAPDANVADGFFNSFIAGALPLVKFLMYQSKLKTTNKVADPLVQYKMCTAVSLTSPEPCAIETEGELAGYLPATVTMQHGRMLFLK